MADQPGIALITGLGGPSGFGEDFVDRNDDLSSEFISLEPIFENGLNFFGREFDGLFVNNNGSVTFVSPRSTFTPDVITATTNNPEITPFFADVDTRGGPVTATPGGNSTGSNLVWYDFDEAKDRFVVTWDDVGYFANETDLLNSFQLILSDRGDGDFDIEFRYEEINWTTGAASGGVNGLGGTIARAGYTAGQGDPETFFELPASGDQDAILALDEDFGNTGDIGRWFFTVRSGDVVSANIPLLPDNDVFGWIVGAGHIATLDGVGYDFNTTGEFVLLESENGAAFQVQGRFEEVAENLTTLTAIATKVGGQTVMLDATDTTLVTIDGTRRQIENFSGVVVGTDRIFREDNTLTIVYAGADGIVNAGDSRLIIDVRGDRLDLDVRLSDNQLGNVRGLLGDGDGDPENDIAFRDGEVVDRPLAANEIYGDYRDEWLIRSEGASLFTYDRNEEFGGFNDAAIPAEIVDFDSLTDAERDAAILAVTNAGLTAGSVNFQNAVVDFAVTGAATFITSSIEAPLIDEANGLNQEFFPVYSIQTETSEITEGDSGQTQVSFTIVRDDTTAAATVEVTMLGAVDADDVATLVQTLDLGVGEASGEVTFAFLGDEGYEFDEIALATITSISIPAFTEIDEAAVNIINDDRPVGTRADDLLIGLSDGDVVDGGAGRDTIRGEAGRDDLTGGRGADDLFGGGGNDSLTGQGGRDELFGGRGADLLDGGGGRDEMLGEIGNDRLNGGGGRDKLNGGVGADDLSGGRGGDSLRGGGGRDALQGDGGADTLNGGTGADQLSGGAGRDVFEFKTGDGRDLISDFTQGVDKIAILEGARDFDDLTLSQSGANVQIAFANVRITVEDQDRGDFSEDDFLF